MTSLTLTNSEGLPVNLPTAATGKSQAQTQIVISLTADGKISLNRQPLDSLTLVTKIQSLIVKDRQTLAIINADASVEHGRVVAIMDRLRQIPGLKLAIATKHK
jgi:biopolymer transport protein ExbD